MHNRPHALLVPQAQDVQIAKVMVEQAEFEQALRVKSRFGRWL